ncbi:hypothetical protein GCM10027184_04990 [Saccharothrix stipae]
MNCDEPVKCDLAVPPKPQVSDLFTRAGSGAIADRRAGVCQGIVSQLFEVVFANFGAVIRFQRVGSDLFSGMRLAPFDGVVRRRGRLGGEVGGGAG